MREISVHGMDGSLSSSFGSISFTADLNDSDANGVEDDVVVGAVACEVVGDGSAGHLDVT